MVRAVEMFPATTEMVAGRWVKYRNITCSKCDFVARVTNPQKPSVEFLTKKFQSFGWRIGPPHLCPKCVGRQANKIEPAQVEALRQTKPEIVMVAEPPKTPTIEQRRRMRDALDEHYNEDASCYRASFSDKAVAAKLDMPEKWIADLREANGFGPNVNEAAKNASRALDELEKRLNDHETAVLSELDALRRDLNKLKLDRSYAA
ncbi:hypothetical protein [Phenylobacterium sp.]|uniref:hypothetical protein n=2 Tax=Phenylobacterium sp. TaxID=1871053 RepID=UPI0025FA5FAD|nr:hypothetical protein [Phenylobacterium sp.]MCA6280673.1 hypothetical protein [Phenylobacterium sp.]